MRQPWTAWFPRLSLLLFQSQFHLSMNAHKEKAEIHTSTPLGKPLSRGDIQCVSTADKVQSYACNVRPGSTALLRVSFNADVFRLGSLGSGGADQRQKTKINPRRTQKAGQRNWSQKLTKAQPLGFLSRGREQILMQASGKIFYPVLTRRTLAD